MRRSGARTLCNPRPRRLPPPPTCGTRRLHSRASAAHARRDATGAEYAHLVRVERSRLALEDFLALLAQHTCTLSPPGKGYDCFRTWQALAVSTVPLVMRDERFDPRLIDGTGPETLPPPEELTPSALEELLRRLQAPPPHVSARLEMAHWRRAWQGHLGGDSDG